MPEIYKNYTDADLEEAYTSMMDYSGKITADLEQEINNRGGLASFHRKTGERRELNKERYRIKAEVRLLTSKDTDYEFVRKLISSDKLDGQMVDELVSNYHAERQKEIRDRQITPNTVTGTLIGILIGIVLGGLLLCLSVMAFQKLLYWLLIPVYILDYFIIKLLTKQSRNNLFVFIGSFLAAIGSLAVVIYLIRN